MFGMEFFVEIELFAENHPFVHVHLVTRHLYLTEVSVGLVSLTTKTFEHHLQIFVVEDFCFLGDLDLLFCLEHVRATHRVVLVGLLG